MSVLSVNSINNLIPVEKTANIEKNSGVEFKDVLNEALNSVSGLDNADKQIDLGLLTGDIDNIHTALIESEKANIALDLTIQIRNKVIDAYNEIMRMQI